jgi:hypothetical protein
VLKFYFASIYFSPLNTFMRKRKDQDPDPYLSLTDTDPGDPNTCGSSVPDPPHCIELWMFFVLIPKTTYLLHLFIFLMCAGVGRQRGGDKLCPASCS